MQKNRTLMIVFILLIMNHYDLYAQDQYPAVIMTWQNKNENWQGACPHHYPLDDNHKQFNTETELLKFLNTDYYTFKPFRIIQPGKPDIMKGKLNIYWLENELREQDFNTYAFTEEKFKVTWNKKDFHPKFR